MFLAVRCLIFLCLFACVIVGGDARTAFGGDTASVSVRSGVAYDYFSQRYFIDSLVASGGDTTLESWEFSRKYLNDFRLWFSADYPGALGRKNRLHILGELSDEQWRLRLAPMYSLAVGQSVLSGGVELERRRRYKGASVSGDSYWFALARTRISVPVGNGVRAIGGIIGDLARFDSTTSSALNYWRVGGSAGVDFEFGNLSSAYLHLFGAKRGVPDSTWLGYQSLGAEASLSWSYNRGDLNAIFRAENRAYDDPDGIDDHVRIDGNIRSKTFLSSRWFVFAYADGEATIYDKDNFLNQSVGRIRSAAMVGFTLSETSTLAVGPHLEWLDERAGLILITPDYAETGIRCDADILAGNSLFATLQSVTGKHKLKQQSETSSSYTFQRIALMGDGRVVGRLSVSLFWSVEWEWHDRASDDTFSHFFSASLSQSF